MWNTTIANGESRSTTTGFCDNPSSASPAVCGTRSNDRSWTVTTVDGQEIEREVSNAPFDMPAAHIFKVGPAGQVHEIEAVGWTAPYMSPSWSQLTE